MRCCTHLNSGQLQHPLGWHLLLHQRFQPEPYYSSQGPGVAGTEARISQKPDRRTIVRGWDIQGTLGSSPLYQPLHAAKSQ